MATQDFKNMGISVILFPGNNPVTFEQSVSDVRIYCVLLCIAHNKKCI